MATLTLDSVYNNVLSILVEAGPAVILPIADPNTDPTQPTFTTIGSEQLVFTWSKLPSTFSTPLDFTDPSAFQGIVPVLSFNGTDEGAMSTDHPFWSAGANGSPGSEPSFSMGAWINLSSGTELQYILSKFDNTSGAKQREWDFTAGGNRGELLLRDESNNAWIGRNISGTATPGLWVFLVATYDGSGSNSGISFYLNSAPAGNVVGSFGSYVAMEDTTSAVRLAFRQGSSKQEFYFGGKMGGGPLGPFFVQGTLSPQQVLDLYNAGASAMGLIP